MTSKLLELLNDQRDLLKQLIKLIDEKMTYDKLFVLLIELYVNDHPEILREFNKVELIRLNKELMKDSNKKYGY